MIRTRTWIILTAAAAAALAVLSWYTLARTAGTHIAEIVQDGKVVRVVDLDRVARSETFTVECPDGGSNTVLVEPGRICVCAADCPDRICVEQGWLSDQAAPIVCMPHRLVIRLREGGTETDAVAR